MNYKKIILLIITFFIIISKECFSINNDIIIIDNGKTEKTTEDDQNTKDNKLKGAIVYIICGHGGNDPGTIGVTDDGHKISEDEYAYDICLRLEKYIKKHNGTAYMIIKDDNNGIRDAEYLPLDKTEKCYPDLKIPTDHKSRLRQRTEAVNKLYRQNKSTKYQIVLDIHIDSRSSSTKLDVFFYHCKNSVRGKRLAENIHTTFEEKYAKYQPNRGYSGTVSIHPKKLYVINNVIPPAILIELGNLQNASDKKRFIKKENREALAKWISEGIIRDFEASK